MEPRILPAPDGVASPRYDEELACLLEATHELNAAADLPQGLAAVAATIRGFVEYSTLGILLLDELGRELRFVFADGVEPEVVEHWRFGLGQGLVGTVARTGETVIVEDVGADPRYIRAADCVRSEMVVPLRAKGRVIGVLDITSARPGYFTKDHARLFGHLAAHLANALETARLYQNTRELARSLSLLHELSRELVSILDRRKLLARVAELVKRIIDYDVITLMLWDPVRELLVPWVGIRRDGTEAGRIPPMPLGHGLTGTAAALRQPLRVPNIHLDPRFVRCQSEVETRSELVIPLVYKDRLLGVLDLESAEYDKFSERDEQLLSTLASSLAIALENAELYERLRADEKRFEDDLATARLIQNQLLPRATPWVPGLQIGVAYQPARELAGDFYDFLPYGENRIAVALGDVAGKATAAALYGAFAVAVLREHAAHEAGSPAKILADLSLKLRTLRVENRFLAMAFAVYDAATSTLTLANGGLPRPYLVRGGEVETILASGVPLGLLAGPHYAETEIVLAPGDTVVLLSDGIEESLDPNEQEFGQDRIRRSLTQSADGTASDVAAALLNAVQRYSGDGPPSDDRTIVVIRREATPGELP